MAAVCPRPASDVERVFARLLSVTHRRGARRRAERPARHGPSGGAGDRERGVGGRAFVRVLDLNGLARQRGNSTPCLQVDVQALLDRIDLESVLRASISTPCRPASTLTT